MGANLIFRLCVLSTRPFRDIDIVIRLSYDNDAQDAPIIIYLSSTSSTEFCRTFLSKSKSFDIY